MMKKAQNSTDLISRFKKTVNNPINLVHEANKGVNSDEFFKFAELSNQNPNTLSGYLNLSFKTLTRYRRSRKKLSPDKSEQLLKWIRLYIKGLSVFGELSSFNNWMVKPAYGLGNMIPINLMNTSMGIDLIMEELQRIEYGDLA
jgi:putative toxin-antitoxin system antitoxin component (TIGR02293 family)